MSRQKAPVSSPLKGLPHPQIYRTAEDVVESLDSLVAVETASARTRLAFVSAENRPVIEQMFRNIAARIGSGPVQAILGTAGGRNGRNICRIAHEMFCSAKER